MPTTRTHPTKYRPAKNNGTAAAKGRRKPAAKKKNSGKRKWSADVTEHSNALDLKKGVFTSDNPKKIAQSLEKSAEESTRKKSGSKRSAMSMLSFYINRAGKNLPAAKKKTLNKAKDELRAIKEKKDDAKKPRSKK